MYFQPLKRGHLPIKDKNCWFQGVLYIEVPLYIVVPHKTWTIAGSAPLLILVSFKLVQCTNIQCMIHVDWGEGKCHGIFTCIVLSIVSPYNASWRNGCTEHYTPQNDTATRRTLKSLWGGLGISYSLSLSLFTQTHTHTHTLPVPLALFSLLTLFSFLSSLSFLPLSLPLPLSLSLSFSLSLSLIRKRNEQLIGGNTPLKTII